MNGGEQVDVGFPDNLSEAGAALAADRAAPERKAKVKGKPAGEVKVRIILEDNEQIPPGGQFIQVNGRSFLIQANYEVEVPRMVCDVLDHAVMSVPITDQMNTVIGYRDRLRFPYRVVARSRED
jgi:hypothetical protein